MAYAVEMPPSVAPLAQQLRLLMY
jgi:hypothetical protein